MKISYFFNEMSLSTKAVKFTKAKSEYKCQRCEKILDLDHEVSNNLKRLQSTISYIGALKNEIQKELLQAFKDGEYTCEKCLKNE